jgi:hypothetical protein
MCFTGQPELVILSIIKNRPDLNILNRRCLSQWFNQKVECPLCKKQPTIAWRDRKEKRMIDLFLDPAPVGPDGNIVDLTDADPRVLELHRHLTEAQATHEANIQALNTENQNLKVLLEERKVAFQRTHSDLTQAQRVLATQITQIKTLEHQVKSSRENAAALQTELRSQIELVGKLQMTATAFEFLQVPPFRPVHIPGHDGP